MDIPLFSSFLSGMLTRKQLLLPPMTLWHYWLSLKNVHVKVSLQTFWTKLCLGFRQIVSLNVVLAAANYPNEHLLYGYMNALLSQSHVHNSSTCFILYSLTTPELFKFT